VNNKSWAKILGWHGLAVLCLLLTLQLQLENVAIAIAWCLMAWAQHPANSSDAVDANIVFTAAYTVRCAWHVIMWLNFHYMLDRASLA
jgi:hypothetical protein